MDSSVAAGFNLTEAKLLAVAKLAPKLRAKALGAIGRREFEKCEASPIYWLDASQHVKTKAFPQGLPYVFTKDPHVIYNCGDCGAEVYADKRISHMEISHGGEGTWTEQRLRKHYSQLPDVRPFTLLEYMPPLVEHWQRSQYFAIEKSRDMMATWLMVAMFTWDAMFHRGRQFIFQSQDATKTLELVQRAKVIMAEQPKFLRDTIGKVVFTKGNSRSGELYFIDQESEIIGLPQGGDQIRQYHPSAVFSDESAFQQQFQDSFTAIKPAIQNGGKYTCISSPNRSYFELLCRDRSDS